jgi:hypothetical protein
MLIDCYRNCQASLSLSVVASALLRRPHSFPSDQENALKGQNPTSSSPVTVYIVAPHTCQTIPLLHALLANRISSSAAAVDLLKKVQLLQFFDLAGLVESIAEVHESIYQFSQVGFQGNPPARPIEPDQDLQYVVFIEGLAPTLSASQRRSGLLQANALLAGLTRCITQLSKLSGRPLVLMSVPVDVRSWDDAGQSEATSQQRDGQGLQLNSAFSGPHGERYRLSCGSATLSQTLEGSLDRLVHVHDALGRAQIPQRDQQMPRQCVIEVIKDRVGNMTGLWSTWQIQIS